MSMAREVFDSPHVGRLFRARKCPALTIISCRAAQIHPCSRRLGLSASRGLAARKLFGGRVALRQHNAPATIKRIVANDKRLRISHCPDGLAVCKPNTNSQASRLRSDRIALPKGAVRDARHLCEKRLATRRHTKRILARSADTRVASTSARSSAIETQ
jgi:hypothetical protein